MCAVYMCFQCVHVVYMCVRVSVGMQYCLLCLKLRHLLSAAVLTSGTLALSAL